jgi:enoyl-CoA hydratase/carnithine racemase
MTETTKGIIIHDEGTVLRLQISRPEKKNALTFEMYAALAAAIRDADQQSKVRVVLLHGTEDCFTSGNDLKDFLRLSPGEVDNPGMQFLAALSQVEKPMIAVVSGPAVGIGTTLLLHCDLVYASCDATFQIPFVNLGLCPEGASSYLLPKLMGRQRAAELMLMGEVFSAEKASALGIVNQIFPADELLERGMERALKLSAQPPSAVRLSKALLNKGDAKVVQQTMDEEIGLFMGMLDSPEAKEAFAAFFERRKADFSAF